MDLLSKAAKGELDKVGELQWSEDMAINVVVAADGYPGSYAKGEVIGARRSQRYGWRQGVPRWYRNEGW